MGSGWKVKWSSKYRNHKSEHLNIHKSEIFDTQTWAAKERRDQVPAGSNYGSNAGKISSTYTYTVYQVLAGLGQGIISLIEI